MPDEYDWTSGEAVAFSCSGESLEASMVANRVEHWITDRDRGRGDPSSGRVATHPSRRPTQKWCLTASYRAPESGEHPRQQVWRDPGQLGGGRYARKGARTRTRNWCQRPARISIYPLGNYDVHQPTRKTGGPQASPRALRKTMKTVLVEGTLEAKDMKAATTTTASPLITSLMSARMHVYPIALRPFSINTLRP